MCKLPFLHRLRDKKIAFPWENAFNEIFKWHDLHIHTQRGPREPQPFNQFRWNDVFTGGNSDAKPFMAADKICILWRHAMIYWLLTLWSEWK